MSKRRSGRRVTQKFAPPEEAEEDILESFLCEWRCSDGLATNRKKKTELASFSLSFIRVVLIVANARGRFVITARAPRTYLTKRGTLERRKGRDNEWRYRVETENERNTQRYRER